VCLFVFSILCVFCFSLDYFVLVLFAFVELGLVSSVVCQDIGWEEHFRNDLLCVEWDIKPNSVVSEEYSICNMCQRGTQFSVDIHVDS